MDCLGCILQCFSYFSTLTVKHRINFETINTSSTDLDPKRVFLTTIFRIAMVGIRFGKLFEPSLGSGLVTSSNRGLGWNENISSGRRARTFNNPCITVSHCETFIDKPEWVFYSHVLPVRSRLKSFSPNVSDHSLRLYINSNILLNTVYYFTSFQFIFSLWKTRRQKRLPHTRFRLKRGLNLYWDDCLSNRLRE